MQSEEKSFLPTSLSSPSTSVSDVSSTAVVHSYPLYVERDSRTRFPVETRAHYDPKTQEFILNSPTLTSRKWWPGGLGKTANHCVLHARLFLDGNDRGIQAFLVPLRDTATHRRFPGITLGEIGPKIGFQSVDNGFCVLDHVRIPSRNMLMGFAEVAPDGSFSKPPMDKLVYFTLVNPCSGGGGVRTIDGAAYRMARVSCLTLWPSAALFEICMY
ncbi:hypothetical protein H310_10344 [Aphanomyces invadans]|uniref:Uncharacterized protein n=1 Tax=Aphanomyces invadans TaxID=157072 RepID=A0A024TRL3_9STRA|nr:hypothetical protein H310_10344 [Aphanomyces invadans]ETV96668.1 hypothetical protein H310_10344 [Aphanomyces invadans]|eukprot:XP_008874931.1 hypothetical protein H310_10344 [Aphanomyces invadans]